MPFFFVLLGKKSFYELLRLRLSTCLLFFYISCGLEIFRFIFLPSPLLLSSHTSTTADSQHVGSVWRVCDVAGTMLWIERQPGASPNPQTPPHRPTKLDTMLKESRAIEVSAIPAVEFFLSFEKFAFETHSREYKRIIRQQNY